MRNFYILWNPCGKSYTPSAMVHCIISSLISVCSYFYGATVNTCECPPAYYGVQCESRREGYLDSGGRFLNTLVT